MFQLLERNNLNNWVCEFNNSQSKSIKNLNCISGIQGHNGTLYIAIVSFVFTIRMITFLLSLTVLVSVSECGVKIAASLGEFQNTRHGVSGMVYKTDDYTIEIQNFNYDEWLEESK